MRLLKMRVYLVCKILGINELDCLLCFLVKRKIKVGSKGSGKNNVLLVERDDVVD